MASKQPPLMRREILEQPEALRRLIELELPKVAELAARVRGRDIDLLFLAARGTSDHAAVFMKYFAEIVAGLPAGLAAPSVFTLYQGRVRLERALVLGISQSGKAADAIEVIRSARQQGALTGCITNDPDSPMALASKYPLYCNAGPERSLPATKTYTTSLALAYALVAEIAGRSDLLDDLRRVPEWVEQALALEKTVSDRAERYRYMDACVILSRGINQCSALEAALKLSETSYLRAHPFSGADFLHGPIAVIDEGSPCLLIAPSGRADAQADSMITELKARGAELLIVSDREELLRHATTPLPMPRVPEFVSPIVSIIVAQLFAYHLARVKGRDPDHPRGLKKVTHTL